MGRPKGEKSWNNRALIGSHWFALVPVSGWRIENNTEYRIRILLNTEFGGCLICALSGRRGGGSGGMPK